MIPTSFTIANIPFKVEFVDLIEDNYGEFDDLHSTIRIANKIKYNGKIEEVPDNIKLNTYYHELFHCFNYYYNTELDESLAQTFANFMCEYKATKQND